MRDPESFDAFYAARAPRLLRNIYLRTGDVSRAEDCVQEAFIRAWRRWGTLENEDPVGWVTTVAWRLAIRDWHRNLREARAWMAKDDNQVVGPPADELLDLRDALAKLPSAQGDVLVLHYLEDLPILKIASLLGMPEGTVKSHLYRGREELKILTSPGGARK